MKLKTETIEGTEYAVIQDGKPVYVDDGKEIAFDAPGTVATISRLNGEAKTHREAKQAAESKLKDYDGIDPTAARDALKTVANFDDKKLVDAGEVDKVKAAAIEATEAKYAPVVEERDKYKTQLHDALIGGSFSRSKYIADKMAIPVDMVQAQFGKHFTISDDGEIIASYANGNQINSLANPGDPAGFDEALEIIIGGYEHKDQILVSEAGIGSGGKETKKGAGNEKTMTRAEYDRLTPFAQRKAVTQDGVKIVD